MFRQNSPFCTAIEVVAEVRYEELADVAGQVRKKNSSPASPTDRVATLEVATPKLPRLVDEAAFNREAVSKIHLSLDPVLLKEQSVVVPVKNVATNVLAVVVSPTAPRELSRYS